MFDYIVYYLIEPRHLILHVHLLILPYKDGDDFFLVEKITCDFIVM